MKKSLALVKSELPKDCKIVAVSKKQDIYQIESLYHQGQLDFAENYTQELVEKEYHLRNLENIRWHFIGNIQKNKLKQIVGIAEVIHSVGSMEIAIAINETARKKDLIQKILLQLNLAHEPTKNGWTAKSLFDSIEDLKSLINIQVIGLMTLPPIYDDPELLRPYFKELAEIRDQVRKEIPTCQELSMGTSGDYLVAADEGATIVRLGTLLFGPRPN